MSPEAGGVWSMADAEFKRELAKAWEEGRSSGALFAGANDDEPNPYRPQPAPHVGTIPSDMLAEMDAHARQAREAVEQ
jgi:hypothetical protein